MGWYRPGVLVFGFALWTLVTSVLMLRDAER